MSADVIRIERPTTNSGLFAHTRWDVLPAAAGLFCLAYFFGLFFLFPHAPLWVMLILGFIYSLMINANINGVGHNFIHNPFFRSKFLNRLFGITQSIGCCFSQTMYDAVHMQHHKGNSDRQDENGDTIDWLSIYRHSHDGEAENPWSYVFLSFFRDDVGAIKRELRKRNNGDVFWGNLELCGVRYDAVRDGDHCPDPPDSFYQLAVHVVFSAFLVSRPLLQLSKRLLSSLRGEPR